MKMNNTLLAVFLALAGIVPCADATQQAVLFSNISRRGVGMIPKTTNTANVIAALLPPSSLQVKMSLPGPLTEILAFDRVAFETLEARREQVLEASRQKAIASGRFAPEVRKIELKNMSANDLAELTKYYKGDLHQKSFPLKNWYRSLDANKEWLVFTDLGIGEYPYLNYAQKITAAPPPLAYSEIVMYNKASVPITVKFSTSTVINLLLRSSKSPGADWKFYRTISPTETWYVRFGAPPATLTLNTGEVLQYGMGTLPADRRFFPQLSSRAGNLSVNGAGHWIVGDHGFYFAPLAGLW